MEQLRDELKQLQTTSTAKQKALLNSLESTKQEVAELRDKNEHISQDLIRNKELLAQLEDDYQT